MKALAGIKIMKQTDNDNVVTNIKFNDKRLKITSPAASGNVLTQLKKGRFYEEKLLSYISRLDLEGVYIDVGANIGNHALFFDMCTKAKKVYAFEAHPEIYRYLAKNIKANKSAAMAYHQAVGETAGKCHIVEVASDIIGGASTAKGGDIDMVPLDSAIKERVSLVKIDVEGGEIGVIKGMSRILSEDKPELIIEAADKPFLKEITTALDPYGYYPIEVFNNTATYHFTTKLKKSSLRYAIYSHYIPRRIMRNS